MRMWEIREGHSSRYGDRRSDNYGDRYYGDRYYGNRGSSEDYDEGFEDGYKKAMKEMESMGERRDSRGRYM